MEPETTTNASPEGSNKTLWIVGVLIIIAVAGYLLMRGGTTSTGVIPSDETTTAGEQSLTELLALGTAQTCTFSQVEGGEGTVYIANGKMRGDFTSLADGKTMVSHMISDGTTAYTWIDGMPTGFKMMMNAAQVAGQQPGTVDVNQKLAFNCSSWSADASVFTPPAGMQFNDLTALTGGIPTGIQ